MGIFDFFRKKKEDNHLRDIADKTFHELFPNGNKQCKAEAIHFCNEYQLEIDLDEFLGIFKYSVCLYHITSDKSFSRMYDAIERRSGGKLTYEIINELINYAQRKHFMLIGKTPTDRKLIDTFFKLDQGLSETTKKNYDFHDNDPEWGYSQYKPILTPSIFASLTYIHCLHLPSGERIKAERIGSIEVQGYEGAIDVYEFINHNNQMKRLYVSGYGTEMPLKAPLNLELYS